MIHSVFVVNNNGSPRLVKFYTPLSPSSQVQLYKQVHETLVQRNDSQCSFITAPAVLDHEPEIQIIYRHYATLYFVFVVDKQESELAILDLIQVFVEALDKCFDTVCELDLVFGWQTLQCVLAEIVQGGMVVETSVPAIVDAVTRAGARADHTLFSSIWGAFRGT